MCPAFQAESWRVSQRLCGFEGPGAARKSHPAVGASRTDGHQGWLQGLGRQLHHLACHEHLIRADWGWLKHEQKTPRSDTDRHSKSQPEALIVIHFRCFIHLYAICMNLQAWLSLPKRHGVLKTLGEAAEARGRLGYEQSMTIWNHLEPSGVY